MLLSENICESFKCRNALKSIAIVLIEATSGNRSSSITIASFFSGNSQYSLVDSVLNSIPKTPKRISVMIPKVMILTIHFSFKLIFVRNLMILGNVMNFSLSKKLKTSFIVVTSNMYWTCILHKECNFFHMPCVFITTKG